MNNAGFFHRFLALLIDLFLLFFIFLILPIYIFTNITSSQDYPLLLINGLIFIIIIYMLSAVFYVIYVTFFTSKFGGTPGKLLTSLRVIDYESNNYLSIKTSFIRVAIGYVFSAQFFGLGFLRIIKNPEKLAWHDELFGTKVIKKGSILPGLFLLLLLFSFTVLCSISIYKNTADKIKPAVDRMQKVIEESKDLNIPSDNKSNPFIDKTNQDDNDLLFKIDPKYEKAFKIYETSSNINDSTDQ